MSPRINEFDNYAVSVGFGVRFTVPMLGPVPIALDFGFPMSKPAGDMTQVFNFWMGFAPGQPHERPQRRGSDPRHVSSGPGVNVGVGSALYPVATVGSLSDARTEPAIVGHAIILPDLVGAGLIAGHGNG